MINKIEIKLAEIEKTLQQKEFWKNKDIVKKTVKQKKIFDNILKSYEETVKEIINLKDLFN